MAAISRDVLEILEPLGLVVSWDSPMLCEKLSADNSWGGPNVNPPTMMLAKDFSIFVYFITLHTRVFFGLYFDIIKQESTRKFGAP